MDIHWYKNAVIYSLDIKTFNDSNNDGFGDIEGLKHRLRYIAGLGVTCIWVLPFFKSPGKDGGYDVTDHLQINPQFGDLGNFTEFIDLAKEYGLHVIIDLILNHTSNEHRWFQAARSDKNSKYRDYYIWAEEKPVDDDKFVIFGEAQGNTNWHYDQKAKAYYYHTFYAHQPDLNFNNREVQQEIMRIMNFWLKMGVSGFRVDAAYHVIRHKGPGKPQQDPHALYRRFRSFVQNQKRDAILLAEVDLVPKEYEKFFGENDQMHMLFNFYLNNYLWLSLADETANGLEKAVKQLSRLQSTDQMANFVRNHDELDLERLSSAERERVYKAFAPKKEMRVYGRGIRRRSPPMLQNNAAKIRLAYSLLFGLPGTPVLRYGEEIGMGDDLTLPERNSVRTIMQWTDKKNAGFSSADPENLVAPVISSGPFDYRKVNVMDQYRDPTSLLNWMNRVIRIRRDCPEIGVGKYTVIKSGSKYVLAHTCTANDGVVLLIHNLCGEPQNVSIDLDTPDQFIDVFGDTKYEPLSTGKFQINPYGYRWLRKKDLFL